MYADGMWPTLSDVRQRESSNADQANSRRVAVTTTTTTATFFSINHIAATPSTYTETLPEISSAQIRHYPTLPFHSQYRHHGEQVSPNTALYGHWLISSL